MKFLTLLLLLSLGCQASAADAQQKIDFIQQHFDQQQQHSRLWQQGWLTFFSSVAAVQGLAYSQTEQEPRLTDRAVGFTSSFLGAADMLLNPLRTHQYASQLRAMPQQTPQQQQAKLARAEQWLAEVAQREQYEQSWINHLLAGVVNAAAGAVVANEGKRTAQGIATFVSGTLASELKIYTAPQQSQQLLQAYQQNTLPAQAAKTAPQRWQFAAVGPVLFASYRF